MADEQGLCAWCCSPSEPGLDELGLCPYCRPHLESSSSRCSSCELDKPSLEFRVRDGRLSGSCVQCMRDSSRERSRTFRIKKRASEVPEGHSKICTVCREILPLSVFRKDSRHPGGFALVCTPCRTKPREGEKVCGLCGQVKPIYNFWHSSESSDGHRSNCYECLLASKSTARQASLSSAAEEALRSGRKTCDRCEKEFELSFFPSSKTSRDGHVRFCIYCYRGGYLARRAEEEKERESVLKKADAVASRVASEAEALRAEECSPGGRLSQLRKLTMDDSSLSTSSDFRPSSSPWRLASDPQKKDDAP